MKVEAMNTAALTSMCVLFVLSNSAAGQVTPARPAAPTTTAARPAGPPPTTAPAAESTRRGGSVPADYRLVSGDKLRIEVYKDPQLSQSLQIRPDGKITLPLVGDVAASGKTSLELRDTIATSLKEYITNPVVTVIVVETVPQQIHVMGEVNAAGPQPLTGPLSILQALAAAGGFRDFANTKDIKILRKTASGTTTIRFNYKDAIKSSAPQLMLQAGDLVIVP
jgi:polysaccharide export outer membrane protein